jgi:hypothetical protein
MCFCVACLWNPGSFFFLVDRVLSGSVGLISRFYGREVSAPDSHMATKCRLTPYLHGSISTVGPLGSVGPLPSAPFWVIVILFAVHKLACAFTPGRIMANSQHLRFWSMPRITILVLSYCVCVDTHKSFEMPLCAWHHHMLSAAVRQKGSVLKPGDCYWFCLFVRISTYM